MRLLTEQAAWAQPLHIFAARCALPLSLVLLQEYDDRGLYQEPSGAGCHSAMESLLLLCNNCMHANSGREESQVRPQAPAPLLWGLARVMLKSGMHGPGAALLMRRAAVLIAVLLHEREGVCCCFGQRCHASWQRGLHLKAEVHAAKQDGCWQQRRPPPACTTHSNATPLPARPPARARALLPAAAGEVRVPECWRHGVLPEHSLPPAAPHNARGGPQPGQVCGAEQGGVQ